MIPPRGCAFVCMARRKDAAKAVEKLKGVKINSNQLKVCKVISLVFFSSYVFSFPFCFFLEYKN